MSHAEEKVDDHAATRRAPALPSLSVQRLFRREANREPGRSEPKTDARGPTSLLTSPSRGVGVSGTVASSCCGLPGSGHECRSSRWRDHGLAEAGNRWTRGIGRDPSPSQLRWNTLDDLGPRVSSRLRSSTCRASSSSTSCSRGPATATRGASAEPGEPDPGNAGREAFPRLGLGGQFLATGRSQPAQLGAAPQLGAPPPGGLGCGSLAVPGFAS